MNPFIMAGCPGMEKCPLPSHGEKIGCPHRVLPSLNLCSADHRLGQDGMKLLWEILCDILSLFKNSLSWITKSITSSLLNTWKMLNKRPFLSIVFILLLTVNFSIGFFPFSKNAPMGTSTNGITRSRYLLSVTWLFHYSTDISLCPVIYSMTHLELLAISWFGSSTIYLPNQLPLDI